MFNRAKKVVLVGIVRHPMVRSIVVVSLLEYVQLFFNRSENANSYQPRPIFLFTTPFARSDCQPMFLDKVLDYNSKRFLAMTRPEHFTRAISKELNCWISLHDHLAVRKKLHAYLLLTCFQRLYGIWILRVSPCCHLSTTSWSSATKRSWSTFTNIWACFR